MAALLIQYELSALDSVKTKPAHCELLQAKSNCRNLSENRVRIFTTLQAIVMKQNTTQLQTSNVIVFAV